MSPTTAYLAATAGQPMLAQHINQFLVSHPAQHVYGAALQSQNVSNGAGAISTNNLWLAQVFTMGSASTIGHVQMCIGATTSLGSLLAQTTLSVYNGTVSAPTTPILSVPMTAEFVNLTSLGSNNFLMNIPMPISGLTPGGTYWLVLQASASAGQNFTLFQSSAVSGASTSTNGTTWTAQTYGFKYTVYDQSANGNLVATWSDGGASWTVYQFTGAAGNLATRISSYTAGQTAAGYTVGVRNLNYTNGILTGTT